MDESSYTRRFEFPASILAAQKRLNQLGLNLILNDQIDWNSVTNLFGHSELSEISPSAHLTLELPSSQFLHSPRERLFWFPKGIPKGKSLWVASSRLGQRPDRYPEWFDALRTLCCNLNKRETFLLSAQGTATDRYLLRAAKLFQLNCLALYPAPKSIGTDWWIQSMTDQPDNATVFPCFFIDLESPQPDQRDQLLMQLALEVRVLLAKSRGNVERFAKARCQHDPLHPPLILRSKNLTTPKVHQRLLDAGCQDWIVFGTPNDADADVDGHSGTTMEPSTLLQVSPTPEFRIRIIDQMPEGEFLFHCTRDRVGPWPDQSEEEFLDDLIFRGDRSHHSSMASLKRILATETLIASNRLTRDSTPVVCFTEIPWSERKLQMQFRPHLARWDFGPVAIAIRKSAILGLGARPVIYGDESTWNSLSPDDRPFFQKSSSATKAGNIIDWSLEREWRIVGDVSLRSLSSEDVFGINA